jgi:hypothetical protein
LDVPYRRRARHGAPPAKRVGNVLALPWAPKRRRPALLPLGTAHTSSLTVGCGPRARRRPPTNRKGNRMFKYQLQLEDSTPAGDYSAAGAELETRRHDAALGGALAPRGRGPAGSSGRGTGLTLGALPRLT